MEQQKKKRGQNWSAEEKISETMGDKEMLRQLISQSAAIIENKNTNTTANLLKAKEWRNITNKLNELCGKTRSDGEIKLAWKRMKLAAKADLSAHRQQQSSAKKLKEYVFDSTTKQPTLLPSLMFDNSATMSRDSERLISAVEKRPVIYDYKLSDHKNRGAVDKAWEEVAIEMDCSVSDCKIKWINLRSSYNRVMRDSETPSGSRGGKKRKRYLLEAMQFLRDFISSHRSSLSNEESQDITQESTRQTSEIAIEESNVEEEAPSTLSSAGEKRKLPSVTHKVAEPLIEYLKSNTGGREKENPMLNFFRSSIDELDKLSDRQKRAFKLDFLKLVDKYVSEAEKESILVIDME